MFLTVLSHEEHRAIVSGPERALVASAGRVIEGVELRIIDDDGRVCAPGEVGEIVARSPQRMVGYWRRPAETSATIVDDWLHTGDLGRLDDRGYLWVVDRKKDMIITGGSNVYSREVEDVLLEIPGVVEAAVVGLPDPLWGEAVTAILVREPGSAVSDADVTAHCKARLADYRRPKRLLWCEQLPRNSYGKVLKRQLKELACQEHR
jgi:acyl-CoA synthetase (AMP-forming)/AMP-acid ligase II